MDESAPVRLGIIGLGKLWETRHRPALERMHRRFRVVMVYDQVMERARRTAQQLRCQRAESLVALVDPAQIDAICLLAPQWFGIYPIELAAAAGLPVYCATPIVSVAEALKIKQLVDEKGLRFLPEMARRYYPATRRLKELMDERLGPARIIQGHTRVAAFDRYGQPGPTSQNAPVSLKIDPMCFLLDWARYLVGQEPAKIIQSESVISTSQTACVSAEKDFYTMILEFPGGALAQMTCYRHQQALWGDTSRMPPGPGYQIITERGMAFLEMPDLIRWHDSTGYHEEHLPMTPSIGEILNEEFYRLVQGQPHEGPDVDDVLAVARALAMTDSTSQNPI